MVKNGKDVVCEYCGSSYYVPKCRLKETRFCSNKCFGKAILQSSEVKSKIIHPSGTKHWRWKGGTINKERGYKLICISGKQVYEHRHLMEKHLGHKLSYSETIHHINGNRSDNRIENLEIIERSKHTHKYHMRGIDF